MERPVIVESSVSVPIEAPYELIDIPAWAFGLAESDYQGCSPAHVAAGSTRSPDGRRMSINVEIIGGSLMVQHYVEDLADKHRLRLISASDVFTPSGRTTIEVVWELSVGRDGDGRCEFTNTVRSRATDGLLEFLARQGIPFEQFSAGRGPAAIAHNRAETPRFAESIARFALRNAASPLEEASGG